MERDSLKSTDLYAEAIVATWEATEQEPMRHREALVAIAAQAIGEALRFSDHEQERARKWARAWKDSAKSYRADIPGLLARIHSLLQTLERERALNDQAVAHLTRKLAERA